MWHRPKDRTQLTVTRKDPYGPAEGDEGYNRVDDLEPLGTDLLHEAREESLERMQEAARKLGANAVLNVRFSTSSVMQGAAEIFVYGTAVFVE